MESSSRVRKPWLRDISSGKDSSPNHCHLAGLSLDKEASFYTFWRPAPSSPLKCLLSTAFPPVVKSPSWNAWILPTPHCWNISPVSSDILNEPSFSLHPFYGPELIPRPCQPVRILPCANSGRYSACDTWSHLRILLFCLLDPACLAGSWVLSASHCLPGSTSYLGLDSLILET